MRFTCCWKQEVIQHVSSMQLRNEGFGDFYQLDGGDLLVWLDRTLPFTSKLLPSKEIPWNSVKLTQETD